jgi:TolB-like protein
MNGKVPTMKHATYKRLFVMAIAVVIAGCSTTQPQTRFLHKNADLGAIAKVAVLPFDNLTQEHSAGDKVQRIFYLELLSLDVFEVTEPGQVTKVLHGGTQLDSLGPADYQKLGKDLGVDGIFTGTVVDYTETRTGNTPTPDVTIQLRLIETHTGSTVWSAGQTRTGAGMSTRLFGVGGESLTEAARRLVRNELQTLLK